MKQASGQAGWGLARTRRPSAHALNAVAGLFALSPVWLIGGTAVLASQTAIAQVTPVPAEAKSAEPAKEEVEQVVVSARRRPERLLDVPVSAIAVGSSEIRQYDMTSVANIKLAVPQITFDRGFTGGGASISMRGVSSSSLDAGVEQSVLVDYDGMAISRGRVLNDGMFDLQGIDVLKGPQALFFGKNSPGGVVSIKSAGPTRVLAGFARIGYEHTSSMPSIEAAVSGPLSDNLGFRVAMLGSKSKGYIENQDTAGVPDPIRTAASGSTYVPPTPWTRLGAEEKQAVRGTLKYSNQDNFDATLKLLLSRYRGQGLQSFSEVMGCPGTRTQPVTVGGFADPTGDCKLNNKSSQGWLSPTIINAWPEVKANGDGQPFSKNDTVMPTLLMNYRFGDITLTSMTGYYDYDYVSQGNADATSYSYFWSYSNERNKSLYQELRAVSSFDGMFNFAVGGHYEHNDRTLFVGGANGPNALDKATGRYNTYDNQQKNKSNAQSIFAQLMVKFDKSWELAAGARYTSERRTLNSGNTYLNPTAAGLLPQGQVVTGSKSENNLSPEATLTYHLDSNTMIYGAYKTGYLAGGFSNPGTLSSVTTIKTLGFDAEKVKGAELGVKASTLGNKLDGSITGYRYEYSGLPLTSLIALDATRVTFVTQNAARTLAQGVEFQATFRPSRALTLRGTASYNDAKFQDFQAAQCYTGQTVAQGCIRNAVTGASTQNLTGQVVYRSPKWVETVGAAYEFNVQDYQVRLNADIRHSDGYYAGLNLNPVSYQPKFTTLNAGLRVSTLDDKWSVALIGRNLTNKIYATLAVDKPGGTGEVFAVAGEPRAVVLQFESRF